MQTSNSSFSRLLKGSRLRLKSIISSVTNNSSPTCRICLEGDQTEALISPCYCSGSMGLVHITCMERWLRARNSDTCEICNYMIETKRSAKSFFEWFIESTSRGYNERTLLEDGIGFILLTPLVILGVFLCVDGALNRQGNILKDACLVALALILLLFYILWIVLTCRNYYYQWRQWQLTNQDIEMVFFDNFARRGTISTTVYQSISDMNEYRVEEISCQINPNTDQATSACTVCDRFRNHGSSVARKEDGITKQKSHEIRDVPLKEKSPTQSTICLQIRNNLKLTEGVSRFLTCDAVRQHSPAKLSYSTFNNSEPLVEHTVEVSIEPLPPLITSMHLEPLYSSSTTEQNSSCNGFLPQGEVTYTEEKNGSKNMNTVDLLPHSSISRPNQPEYSLKSDKVKNSATLSTQFLEVFNQVPVDVLPSNTNIGDCNVMLISSSKY